MRYSKEHKAETHARIVRKASVRLRERGVDGIGVADLMKDAGLTHGGFYAHFSSREALVVEAFTDAIDRSNARWARLLAELPPEERLLAIVDGYLSAQHRDNPGKGCAVTALGADVARANARSRKLFAAKIDDMFGMLASLLPGDPAEARKKAITTFSTLVGAIVLARIAGTTELSDEILATSRSAISEWADLAA